MRLTWWSLKGCQRLIRLATECKLFGHNSAMMFLISRSCPQPDGPLIRASDHRSDHGKRSLHHDNATLPWWTQGNSADLSLVVEKVHFRWDPLQSTRSTAIHLLRTLLMSKQSTCFIVNQASQSSGHKLNMRVERWYGDSIAYPPWNEMKSQLNNNKPWRLKNVFFSPWPFLITAQKNNRTIFWQC